MIRHAKGEKLPSSQLEAVALLNHLNRIVPWKFNPRKAGKGNRGQLSGLLRHIGPVKIAVVCRVVKVIVGVGDAPYRLFGKTLAVGPDVPAPVAGINHQSLLFPFRQIRIISVA